MMKRAMGGLPGFAAMSPTVILKAAAAAKNSNPSLQKILYPEPASRIDNLAGDAIPDRAGLSVGSGGNITPAESLLNDITGMVELPDSTLDSLRLPPTIVMSSCADHMVPWHEGAEYVTSLHRVGAPARHLIYNHVGHSDYVMAWKPARRGLLGRGPLPPPPLKDFARDFLKLLRRQVPLTASRPAARANVVAAATSGRMHRLEGLAHISRL